MADRTTNHTEAAESTLSSSLAVGATTINVTDTSSFPAVPFYATIDPGDDTKRETVYVDSAKTGTTLTLSASTSRGQGNTTDVAHGSGARIIHGPTASAMNDLHDRIDADRTDFDAHDHDGTDSPQVATSNLTGHTKAAHDALALDHGSLSGLADFTTDHGAEHDVHDHSAAASTIASADLADHNKSVHDALGIDAATLGGNLPAAFAAVAGDTFTGLVTFDAGIKSQATTDTYGPTDGPSSWPEGLTWQVVTTGAWPSSSGTVVTLNASGTTLDVQWFVSNGATPNFMSFRKATSATVWGDWHTLTSAENPGTWEVDNHTEEPAANSFTATWETVASVTLNIPSDWSGWKCASHATALMSLQDTATANMRMVIDGTNQQATGEISNFGGPVSISARRAGMTTTGSRTVLLQVQQGSGSGSAQISDMHLYARAVRTG